MMGKSRPVVRNSKTNYNTSQNKSVSPLQSYRHNNLWSYDETIELLTHAKAKRSPEEISKKLNRSVSQIRSRLKTIAADMYIKDKIAYENIYELTGVDKSAVIINSSTYIHTNTSNDLEMGIPQDAFKDDIIPREISIDIEDIPEDPVTTVSMESPFTVESFCEHVSKPIMNTVIACSKLVKKIGTYHSNPTLISTSRLQSV
jgi:DNA-binding Lrp family transcriptional regulator